MNLRLSNEAIRNLASSQAIPTNALTLFESSAMSDTDITKIFETDFIEELYLQENRCLRAPGSSCFSALDCAPNPYISSTIDLINEDDATVQSILNRYEILFWKEELICSQEYDPDDDEYDIGENRCCRETGKNITIPTSTVDASNPSLRDIDYDLIPGVSTSLNSQTRNSRLSTVWDLMSENSTQYPPLTVNEDNQCASGACANFSELENQFNTFAKMADRTCCSKNWIRNFDENNNGGGHTWNPDKTQTIPKESFRCYNYIPCEDDNGDSQLDNNECSTISYGDFVGFNCAHTPTPDNSNCTARNIPLGEAEEIFSWVEKFELTGIPQIAIEGSSFANLECQVNPDDQSTSPTTAPPYTIPPDLLETPDTQSNAEYSDGTGHYFSATDSDNFNEDNIKTVFSSDTLTCCLPAGTLMGSDGDPSECCTGYIGSNKTCQLPNYSNVSLYLNRYVSSEAQDEGLGSFDPHTGYLRSSTDVIRIACQKNICESGAVVPGVSLSSLRVRGHETSNFQKQRFIDGNDESNDFSGFATIYDRGIRWNTHIYCTDDTLQTDLPNTFDCSNF